MNSSLVADVGVEFAYTSCHLLRQWRGNLGKLQIRRPFAQRLERVAMAEEMFDALQFSRHFLADLGLFVLQSFHLLQQHGAQKTSASALEYEFLVVHTC